LRSLFRRQRSACLADFHLHKRALDITCLLEILIAKDDLFAGRRALLDYELCLFELVRPHLSRDRLDKLAPIGLTLQLLRARIDGEVAPLRGCSPGAGQNRAVGHPCRKRQPSASGAMGPALLGR